MHDKHTIGIDLGGTYIKGGVCTADGALIHHGSTETQASGGFEHVVKRMAALVGELITAAKLQPVDIAGVGVGAPGPLSTSRGVIYNAPNLPGWANVPLRDRLAELTGLAVSIENDANAAAYGEFVAGAGKDVRSIVFFTLGTGVGGGIVLDGELWRGGFDSAAEVGHMIVIPNGRPCPCGQSGCLERYASANAIGERVVEALQAGESSILSGQLDKDQEITSRDVLGARQAGDALAARIWDEACLHLAVAAINMQHLLNPQSVVLGGGLINAGDELLTPVREYFRKLNWKMAEDQPEIALATLGTDAGTIGAAMLAGGVR